MSELMIMIMIVMSLVGTRLNKFSKNNIPEILEKDVSFFPGNLKKNYSNFSSN